MTASAGSPVRAACSSVRRAVAVVAWTVLIAGCGSASGSAQSGAGSRSSSTPPRPALKVSATQQHLAADGSVPFVDERASDSDFAFAPDPPPDTRGAKPCRAEQLHAVLAHWYRQGEGDTEGGRRPPPGVYGFVSFAAATSDVRCTLQGQPATELLIDGNVVPLRVGDSITTASKRVLTLISATASADLRVDWSPPFCDPPGQQQLHFTLPHDGGDVTAAVLQPRTPACASAASETGGELRSYLSPSAFTQHQRPTELNSPLAGLKATVVGAPTRATGSQELHFRVRLTNSTSSDIPLDPCPGYVLERFILGTAGRAGVSDALLYRLNCRPVALIAAHHSLEFQVQTTVPPRPPGPKLTVTWRLLSRGLGSGAVGVFSVALTP